MRTVLLASLRSHLRRYVAVGLAVGIGVAFVVVTGAITSATREGLSAGVGAPYAGAEAVATGVEARDLDRLHEAAAADDARLSVVGATLQPAQPLRSGGSFTEDVFVGALPQVTAPGRDGAVWPAMVDGRWPAADGEVLMDARAAEVARVALGDTLRVGEGPEATDVTVVGTADGGPTSATNALYLRWDDLRGFADTFWVDAAAWDGPGSVADAESALAAALPRADVEDAASYVDARVVEANNGVDVLAIMLLLFAAVALVTATLVIANTFTILLAQRRRELALLRCVGATRAQLRRAVRVEALLVGGLATLAGLLGGTGLGRLVVAVVRDRAPGAGLEQAPVGWVWYAAAAAVGLLVTLVAAWLPTRRAVTVPPVAALGPEDETRLSTGAGRLRFATGLLGVGVGAALLALAVTTANVLVMIAGGTLAFSGLVLLGPVVVPALIRLTGRLTGRLGGTTVRLAAGNAVRDPRRTAAATASLLIGVTLTTATLTGIASATSLADSEMAAQHPLDGTVTATGGPLGPEVVDRVEGVSGVGDAVAIPGTTARVPGAGELTLLAPDAASGSAGLSLDPAVTHDLAPDEIRVTPGVFDDGLVVGEPLTVRVGEESVTLTPVAGDGVGEAALVAPATLERLDPDAAAAAVWVRADAGVAGDDLAADLGAVASAYETGAEVAVTAGLASRDYVDLQLLVVTAGVVGLLGIAVLIAVAGIANTLGLSVLERTRELALLRALGLSRGGLRAVLAVEGLLLAVVATLLGTAVGVVFAWVGLQTMIVPAVGGSAFVLPLGQLAAVVLAAAVAGLLAAVLPARRAARIAPAAGLTAL